MCNFTFVCDLATLSGVSSADIVGDSLDPTQHFQHSPCPMSLKDTPWHYRDICRGRRGPGLGGRKYMHCISLTHTYSLETVRPQILARKATTRVAPPSPMYSLAKTRAAPPSPMYSRENSQYQKEWLRTENKYDTANHHLSMIPTVEHSQNPNREARARRPTSSSVYHALLYCRAV